MQGSCPTDRHPPPLVELPPDIQVRIVRDEAPADWREVLSPEEKERRASFRSATRQESFARGRVAARLLLGERLGVPPAAVALEVAADGSLLAPTCGLCISIAHSGGWAAAAVGERPVGIDLERIVPRRPDLHRYLLHPGEYDRFERLPLDRTRALLLYWTIKEATLKGLRTGLRLSPKKLFLDLELDARRAAVRVADAVTWQARFVEEADYLWAVAFRPD